MIVGLKTGLVDEEFSALFQRSVSVVQNLVFEFGVEEGKRNPREYVIGFRFFARPQGLSTFTALSCTRTTLGSSIFSLRIELKFLFLSIRISRESSPIF